MAFRKKTEQAADQVAEQVADTPAVEAKPAAKKYVLFVSKEQEFSTYNILVKGENLRPVWDGAHKHLIWECPADLAEAFKLHHHFVTGRVVEKK